VALADVEPAADRERRVHRNLYVAALLEAASDRRVYFEA
jgi:hypothetical protein